MVNIVFARDKIIGQTFREVLPGKFNSPEATVLLLAIGLQESRFEHREQIGGPARSFWQFERGGGVRGVLNCEASRAFAQSACLLRLCVPTPDSVYQRMLDDDLLGCAFARLLLWTDAAPLPKLGEAEDAWNMYQRNWRPGKPIRHSWDGLYAQALEAVKLRS